MAEQATQGSARAERIGKVIHAWIHGDRGKMAGIVVNLSRTGALLTVRGAEWRVQDDDPELDGVGLRVAAHFGGGMRIEFLEAGRTIDAEVVRYTKREIDGRPVICLGCRFPESIDSDVVAAITRERVDEPDEAPAAPIPQHPLLQVRHDEPDNEDGVPLRPRGVARTMRDLLVLMEERSASDLHIRGNSPLRIRVHGQLSELSERPLFPDEAHAFMDEILTPEEKQRFDHDWDLDFGYAADDIGRFRVNVLKSRGELGMAIRRIPSHVPTIDELGLAPACREIANSNNGLVLVTGPTGSGKSTTLAAMIRHINETRACHIVTMEDPIEFVHREQKAHITQREVGRDVKDFHSALRRAMRQDPDVLLVGEMRDLETIALAVTAAETGHLVFGTLHTTSASTTVERIVDVFPPEQQEQIRMQLAGSLRAICSQILVPRRDGGQVAAQELLIATRGVRALIRERKAQQLGNMMQTGGREGMQTLEDALNRLVSDGTVRYQEAAARANDASAILAPS